MKITAIKPFIVGEVRNFFFVVVETDEGITGLGEGGSTWREQAMAGFVDGLTPSLIGQDPLRTEHLWQVMYRCGFFPAGRIGAAAQERPDQSARACFIVGRFVGTSRRESSRY